MASPQYRRFLTIRRSSIAMGGLLLALALASLAPAEATTPGQWIASPNVTTQLGVADNRYAYDSGIAERDKALENAGPDAELPAELLSLTL